MNGVNEELGPWLRMTVPPEASEMHLDEAPLGTPLFSSWVLLGGLVPIDRHHFMLSAVEHGRGFLEDSTSWTQRRWQHQRSVEPSGEQACIVTDRLTFTPRLSPMGPLLARIIGAVFRRRHARLAERFTGQG
ncbi:MAG TPA: hypothetical protein VK524_24160 [Polyangiaceae bacterium]|nr:hypothetical protein [Polyangiaceae bacterium]